VFAAVEGGRAHDVKYQVVGYCYGYGVQDAMERHREGTARVIPIILRPRCGTTRALRQTARAAAGREVCHYVGDAGRGGFLDIVRGIRAAIERMS
jgi:hypothetical protein